MKHKYFYIYQVADILFTSSCRAVAILLSWIMINIYHLQLDLGTFITISWVSQVIALIIFSLFSDKFNKKNIPIYCSLFGLIFLIFLYFYSINQVEQNKLAIVFILTSVLSIIIQPIGSSITPLLYGNDNLEKAFRIRGFVNSINTVFGAAISGFVIHSFNVKETVLIITIAMFFSFILFLSLIKLNSKVKKETNSSYFYAINSLINHRLERVLVLISATSNFILTPTLFYITPILVVDIYKLTSLELGFAESNYGIGMILGAFSIVFLNKYIGVRVSTILGLNMVALGLFLILFLNNIYSVYLGLLISGFGAVVYNINTTKIRCSATPEKLRSSFESIFLAVCIIPIPFGFFFSTLIIQIGSLYFIIGLFSVLIMASSIPIFLSKDFKILSKLSDENLNECYPNLFPEAYRKK